MDSASVRVALRWLLVLFVAVAARPVVAAGSVPVIPGEARYVMCIGQGWSQNVPACSGTPAGVSGGVPGGPFGSRSEACQGYLTWIQGQYTFSPGPSITTCPTANGNVVLSSPAVYATMSEIELGASCPSNSTMGSGACQCSEGFQPSPSGTSCVRPPDACAATAGKPLGGVGQEATVSTASRTPPAVICSDGCQYTFARSMTGSLNGVYTHVMLDASQSKGTGVSCDPSPTPPAGTPDPSPTPAPKPGTPPPGQCPGTVNGVEVYVPCTSTESGGPKSETKPPTTSPSPPGSTPGSSGSGLSTTCTGGSCTSTKTETTNNGDGTTTTTETVTEETKDEFCVKNPASPQCADRKSSFAGGCGAFVCTGDAVDCAVAREVYQRNCQLFDTATPLSDLGIASANGQATPTGHPGNSGTVTAFNLQAMLTDVPLVGSNGACPSDVTVGGRVIAFSGMCGSLNLLGAALKAFAYLIAAFIVFRKGVA